MLFKATHWLTQTATVKRLAAVFILNSLIRYALMPWLHVHWMPAGSPGPLDLMFAYSADDAANQIAGFTDASRAGYRMFLLTVDVIYPITYTLMFAWMIALLKQRTRWEGATMLLLPALAAFAFDMLENVTVSLLLTLYPQQPTALGWAASVFTTMKWLSVAVTLSTILWLIVVRLRSNQTRN